jgi:hypothetical protein
MSFTPLIFKLQDLVKYEPTEKDVLKVAGTVGVITQVYPAQRKYKVVLKSVNVIAKEHELKPVNP